MQLQKLMFFAQVLSLIDREEPILEGVFEAWTYGPVLPEVYVYTKGWGSTPITVLIHVPSKNAFDIYAPTFEGTAVPVKRVLEDVWRSLSKYSATQLSNLSHLEGSPWHVTITQKGTGQPIPASMMRNFYRSWVKRA